MIGLIFGLAVTAGPGPHVLDTLGGRDFARMGIVAQIVERPEGVSDVEFAQRLIDAEGLRPWNGEQIESYSESSRTGIKAVVSADGREILVSYLVANEQESGRACRIRFARGGWSDARWNAYRWCALGLGFEPPLTPPPPIVTIPR